MNRNQKHMRSHDRISYPPPKMRLLILAIAATAAAAVLVFLEVSAARVAPRGPLFGGWMLIANLSDPHVRETAEFAVKTHNDEAKTGLLLEKVFKGEMQVVGGANYRLVIKAKDRAGTKNYEAVVWERLWEHLRGLTSFKAV
ncbi:hypothetical protein BT93_F2987 [Corymbia citriodora subsp. variegata]|nr:hypothetical protein BT93_F2987 [Corymbia citriodora subsp. variegata]